jgi:O-antigen ligase
MLGGIFLSSIGLILFTLWQVNSGGTFVPDGFWQADGTFRATGWYGFPNGVGIFLGLTLFPVLLFLKENIQHQAAYVTAAILYFLLTITCILFAKSTGALLGIAAGFVVLLLALQRTRRPIMLIGVLGFIVFYLLPTAHPVKQELLLQDRSGQIRTHMWAEAVAMLQDHPIRGAGMASYAERIEPYHTTVNGEGIEIFHHPHNIFLTIWANTGFIGLVGFILVLITMGVHAIRSKQWHVLAFIVGCIVMGLVDSPYIKNDWAVVFWAMIAFTYYKRD